MRLLAYVYAWRGVRGAFLEEHNFRIHLVAAEAVVYLALSEGVHLWIMGALAGLIALVLALELMNTAVERAVDLAHPAEHPLAAAAKDAAAGAVLVGAIGAAVAGVLLLGPGLGRVQPWRGGGQLVGLLVLALLAFWTLRRSPRRERR